MADGTDNRVFDRMAQASKDPGISLLFELRKQNFLDVLGKGIRAKREGATDRQIVDFMKSKLKLTGRTNFSDKAYLDIIKGGKMSDMATMEVEGLEPYAQDYMIQYVYNF